MTQYEKDLAAVRKDGHAIRHVKEQTPELCLEAVKQNGYAVRHIKNQTPEICMAAVKQNAIAAGHIGTMTPDILSYLIQNNIPFDLRRLKKDIPNDLKLLLILNYGVSPSRFK